MIDRAKGVILSKDTAEDGSLDSQIMIEYSLPTNELNALDWEMRDVIIKLIKLCSSVA